MTARHPQPITTRPELGLINDVNKVVFVGTGRYLGLQDLTDPATQTPQGHWRVAAVAVCLQGSPDQDYGEPARLRATAWSSRRSPNVAAGRSAPSRHNAVDWTTNNGWYIDFNPGNKSPGERMNVDMQLALGTLLIVHQHSGRERLQHRRRQLDLPHRLHLGQLHRGVTNNVVARKQSGVLTVGTVIYQLQKGSLVGQVQRVTDMVPDDIPVSPNSSPSRRTSWREMTPELTQ